MFSGTAAQSQNLALNTSPAVERIPQLYFSLMKNVQKYRQRIFYRNSPERLRKRSEIFPTEKLILNSLIFQTLEINS